MPALRITLADLTLRRACAKSIAPFLANAERIGHAADALVYPEGWTQENTDRCLAMQGGPEFLTFLEYYGLVPVFPTDPARFTHPQTKALRAVISKYIGPDGFARVPSAGWAAARVAEALGRMFQASAADGLAAGLAFLAAT